jgi:hypothetical protein
MRHPIFNRLYQEVQMTKEAFLSEIIDVPALFGFTVDGFSNADEHDAVMPHSILVQPVFKGFPKCHGDHCTVVEGGDSAMDIGALALVVLPWDGYLHDLLPHTVNDIDVVVQNTCGDIFTFRIDGPTATFVGVGDHHDSTYDHLEHEIVFDPSGRHDDKNAALRCNYRLSVYPSIAFEHRYYTTKPVLLCFAVALIFVLTAAMFLTYDCLVQQRQKKVMESALKTNAIVSSLFPKEVRDRLLHGGKKDKDQRGQLFSTITEAPKFRLNSFLVHEEEPASPKKIKDASGIIDVVEKPIADLFLNTTVMFADIAGKS